MHRGYRAGLLFYGEGMHRGCRAELLVSGEVMHRGCHAELLVSGEVTHHLSYHTELVLRALHLLRPMLERRPSPAHGMFRVLSVLTPTCKHRGVE